MKKIFSLLIIGLLFFLVSSGFRYLQAEYRTGAGKTGKIISIKILPKHAVVKTGKTKSFVAVVKARGKVDKSVDWSVEGGDINGTITALDKKHASYKAPDSVPEGGKVTIKATSSTDSSKSGTATIKIKGGSPTTTTTTTTTTSSTTTTTIPPVTPGSQVNNTITIQNFSFSPLNIGIAPGTTITVTNKDSFQHSVTSESKAGNFTPGSVNGISFDTTPFTTPDKTIIIPADAVPGTVIPYYCSVHTSTMTTKTGFITVQ